MSTYLAPRNEAFEKGSWLKSIIWDEKEKYNANFTKLNLNLNDTEMLLELDTDGCELLFLSLESSAVLIVTSAVDLPILQAAPIREIGLDPYNLSNDRAYEVAKETKERIRQTFGLLEVQHAYPAQKLQLPFYKTRLTKSDARSFHRPGISFMSGIQFNFTKVRNFKKKVDKVTGRKIKKSDGILRTMSDVSLRENCNYVLWEYSEESPPIISNIGMGSILVNYYRKKDTKDEFIPKVSLILQ